MISKNSKNWILNRDYQIERYRKEYINYVKEEIKKYQKDFDLNDLKLIKTIELNRELEKLQKKIEPTQIKMAKLRKELEELRKELGI